MNELENIELDVSGLTCPLPLLKTKQVLNKLSAGETVKVIATDPGSERDFHVFAEQSSTTLIAFEKQEGHFYYWLKKG